MFHVFAAPAEFIRELIVAGTLYSHIPELQEPQAPPSGAAVIFSLHRAKNGAPLPGASAPGQLGPFGPYGDDAEHDVESDFATSLTATRWAGAGRGWTGWWVVRRSPALDTGWSGRRRGAWRWR